MGGRTTRKGVAAGQAAAGEIAGSVGAVGAVLGKRNSRKNGMRRGSKTWHMARRRRGEQEMAGERR